MKDLHTKKTAMATEQAHIIWSINISHDVHWYINESNCIIISWPVFGRDCVLEDDYIVSTAGDELIGTELRSNTLTYIEDNENINDILLKASHEINGSDTKYVGLRQKSDEKQSKLLSTDSDNESDNNIREQTQNVLQEEFQWTNITLLTLVKERDQSLKFVFETLQNGLNVNVNENKWVKII